MVGRIREIVFDDGVDVDGIAEIAASTDYVDDKFTTQGALIIDPHGWTEYDDTYMTRSWVGTTFTLTQVGTSTPYYHKGVLKFLTGNKSITLDPTPGPHFIALNCSTEELEDLGSTLPIAQVTSTHLITEFAYCSGVVVLYNANERHTTKFLKRDWIYKHLSFSTQYRSGITPSITSIDGNGSSIDHARWSVTAGQIADEDIDITTAALISSAAKNLWWYNPAVSVWTKYSEVNGTGVIPVTSGRAQYNNYATGLVECTNNYHVLTHVFAANDGTVIGIVGNEQYQLVADARIAASSEIDTLLSTGLPFPEFRAIATFINKTSNTYSNAVKSIIVSVDTGVPYIDWRRTALNPAAGQSATNHQALSGLQGGQAGEYYHLTAAQYANVFNNVFPTGTSSNTQNKIYLPTNTTSGWNGLTASESLIGWDSTKKKPIVGDGSVFKPIGGGLVPTPIDKDYATALETGKHYIYNGAGMTGDKTLNVQAVATESNFKVTVYNIPSGYKLILDANASETFRKDDTDYTTVEFVATEVEQSAEFVSNNTQWIVDDGSNALGTVWSGSLEITGSLVACVSPSAKSGSDAAVTLTSDSLRFQVVTLTAARVYKLPSTGILAGDTFTFINRATNDSYRLNLQASADTGTTYVDWIVNGKITVMALQDAPTAAAHWATIDAVSDWVVYTPKWYSSASEITPNTDNSFNYKRDGGIVVLTGLMRDDVSRSSDTNQVEMTLPTGLTSVTMPNYDCSASIIFGSATPTRSICGATQVAVSSNKIRFRGATGTNTIYVLRWQDLCIDLGVHLLSMSVRVPVTEWSMFN